MGRILAVDYGLKRTGLAVTDPHRIIATALDMVETRNLMTYLRDYLAKETVDEFVVGLPRQLNNQESQIAPQVKTFVEKIKTQFPGKPVALVDERFTSLMARQAMIIGGMKKKDRRIKGNVDKISATLILQFYLESRQ
jgi:putative Holliday junction resolvase